MNKINGGCILLARKIQESKIWTKNSDYLKIWLHILLEVSHRDRNLSNRGENFFNKKQVALDTGCSYHTVDNCVRWLKTAKQITTRKTTRGLYIKVLRYEQYQDFKSYSYETKNGIDNEITTKQERNRNETINKNDNNEKNDNKNTDPEFEIFWKLYPNKKSKQTAIKTWSKLSLTEKLLAIEKLPDHLKSQQWVKDGGQFVPHPSSWLNQKRWIDEIKILTPIIYAA